jgi:hypothetical protein
MATYPLTPEVEESRVQTARFSGEANSSGVSWGAVIGGAFAASALYLILLALGAGFGLSTISPWSYASGTAPAAGAAAIVWLIAIEIAASAFGGYLTGRLRTKWAAIHTHEVFFRDTANGFLAWAVALIASAAFLSSAAAQMAGNVAAGNVVQARSSPEGVTTSPVAEPTMYFVDALFRSDRPGTDTGDTAAKTEAARILANGLKQPEMAPADEDYLTRLVASRTGLGQIDASKRVSDVVNEARQAEDRTRKATGHLLLWLFLSLLMGAFTASYAATIGGRQRDHVKAV